jgi:tRNA modification GTPase
MPVSVSRDEGIDRLFDLLEEKAAGLMEGTGAPPLTRARHRLALEEAAAALGRVFEAPLPELAAEDLRLAVRAVGRITGRVDVEEMLDVVFRDFCIGK